MSHAIYTCKDVVSVLSEVLTPGEMDLLRRYIDSYGEWLGIATLIVDLMRGRNRFARQPFDDVFAQIEELMRLAIHNSIKPQQNSQDSPVVQILDPAESR